MKTYLTLDVGGSAIKYALMQEDLTILEKSSVPTPMDTLENFIETIGKRRSGSPTACASRRCRSASWPRPLRVSPGCRSP